MNATLSKTVVVAGTIYPAGSKVSDDVAAKITAEGVFASRVATQQDAGGSEGYNALKVDELEAEVEKRNADRDPENESYIRPEGTGKDGKVLKADLVAALEADDKA